MVGAGRRVMSKLHRFFDDDPLHAALQRAGT